MKNPIELRKEIDGISRPSGYNIHAWKVLKKLVLKSLLQKKGMEILVKSSHYNNVVISKFNHLYQAAQ